MPNVHRTSRGVTIDMDRLKLINETTVAVGNAGVNARGDLVKGNQVVKTREQLIQETYNISGNNIAKDAKIRTSEKDIIQPDPISSFEITNPRENLIAERDTQTVVPNVNENSPRGGLASAVQKSQDIQTVLANQRKRI
jgi:hypothetical protein